jgi:hypothetical protein
MSPEFILITGANGADKAMLVVEGIYRVIHVK